MKKHLSAYVCASESERGRPSQGPGRGSPLPSSLPIEHGRRAVGIDRDADYVALARRRVADYYAGRLTLRPLDKPVHQPSGREKVAQIPLRLAERRKHMSVNAVAHKIKESKEKTMPGVASPAQGGLAL